MFHHPAQKKDHYRNLSAIDFHLSPPRLNMPLVRVAVTRKVNVTGQTARIEPIKMPSRVAERCP
jgi:hypothetical protein